MASKVGRISEADLLIPTLRILAAQPNGSMPTSNLIAELEHIFKPQGEDAEILEGRDDTRFSQIVRNMVSHKAAEGNIVADGFATYLGRSEGLKITDFGRAHLKNKDGCE
jgi:hypothetical protein